MNPTLKELKQDTELLTAALLQVPVYIVPTPPFDPDGVIEFVGIIESYSKYSVQIGGTRYMRAYHSFRVQSQV